MEIHFLVVEKSWKIIVEKEWSPCTGCMQVFSGWSDGAADAEF